jgi:hypothetical protein
MEDEKVPAEAGQLVTEIKTVETLLDRGVRVELPAPFLLRLFGKKTVSFILKRPTSETMYRISGLYLQMRLGTTKVEVDTIDESHRLIAECMVSASRIIAYSIAPHISPLSVRNRFIARYLRRRLNTRELAELWMIVVNLSGVQDFCNTIRSMSTMRMTIPRTKT